MTITITYEASGHQEFPLMATTRVNGTFMCACGRDRENAKEMLLQRIRFLTIPIPEPEEVEI